MGQSFREFELEAFEMGKGLWHASAHRADGRPMLLDGVRFSELNGGICWPTPEQALDDVQGFLSQITDRLGAG